MSSRRIEISSWVIQVHPRPKILFCITRLVFPDDLDKQTSTRPEIRCFGTVVSVRFDAEVTSCFMSRSFFPILLKHSRYPLQPPTHNISIAINMCGRE